MIGVMRFLQIEWHNHERARNAWDIERADMKAKIAKQEGECRKANKLNDQLEKQIRMLERALKNERAKSRGAVTGDKTSAKDDSTKDLEGKTGIIQDPKSGMDATTCAFGAAVLVQVISFCGGLTWCFTSHEQAPQLLFGYLSRYSSRF